MSEPAESKALGVQPGKKTLWAWTVATFFGAGLGKPGPGTWGSVATVLIWTAIAIGLHPSQQLLLSLTLAGIVLSVALGVPAATIAARESGRKDPGFVVIDEVAGQAITLLAIPLAGAIPNWENILLALLLFRIFDITKPVPVRQLEKLPEGWGIVFDDVAAGLYAGAVLLLAIHWLK
ncbi:phosphatidylglycerophosphatase A family protein [Acidicapsa ligni]|uniref:phosphatidylglycerophosphatase A family protein n=1 Tax=Acidicapsa ligni TaxID=542300 RepID=UPI0021DFDAA3|nr:phosphatidylglycerophosphatase A [Acidicapsa ligni]